MTYKEQEAIRFLREHCSTALWADNAMAAFESMREERDALAAALDYDGCKGCRDTLEETLSARDRRVGAARAANELKAIAALRCEVGQMFVRLHERIAALELESKS